VSRTIAAACGFYAGFVLGLLVGIAYNTSSQTSVLEGGHAHLKFGGIIVVAVVLGSIGAALGSIAVERRDR